MKPIFIDSSFWIARRDERDAHNGEAELLVRELIQRQCCFVVTPFIFAESHAHFIRSQKLRERIIRDFWENPAVIMEEVSVADQKAALDILRQQRDKQYSFCDAISFTIIRRLKLRQAVSFDIHFRQFGEFELLTLSGDGSTASTF